MEQNFGIEFTHRKYATVILFFCYFLCCLFLYRNTIGCRLVTDAQNWLLAYDNLGWKGIISSFGEDALHPGYHFFFFIIYRLFGLHEQYWYLLFVLLHTVNALCIYTFFKKYLKQFNLPFFEVVPLFASLLFLISPYQTEVVVWGATIHYLLVTLMMFFILNLCNTLLLTDKKWNPLFIPLLYILAIYTLELAICIPFITGFLFLVPNNPEWKLSRKSFFLKVSVPLLIITIIYFITNKIFLHEWVGHYGASVHLHFSIPQIVGNFNKYLFKYLLFGNFFPDDLKVKILAVIDLPVITYLSLILYVILFGILIFYRKLKPWQSFFLLLFFCFAAGFISVINLFFYSILPIEADRLSYLPSLFFFLFLSTVLVYFLKQKAITIIGAYAIFSGIFLIQNLKNWESAAIAENAIESQYIWKDATRVFILNTPDSYNGAYMYRDKGNISKFKAGLELKSDIKIPGEVIEVLQYNMTALDNAFITEIIDSNTLRIEFAQWGNWWWRGGIGASDYENDLYKVDIDEWSHAYSITFKQKQPGDVYLYQNRLGWNRITGF